MVVRGLGWEHRMRSGWAVALATSIGLVALWLAPAARAASCSTSGGGTTLNVTIASGQSVSVRINNANTILVERRRAVQTTTAVGTTPIPSTRSTLPVRLGTRR